MKSKFQNSILLLAVIFLIGIGNLYAQSPCPRYGPCDEIPTPTPSGTPTNTPTTPGNTVTLSAMLEEMVVNVVAFKTAFISTVEGTLGGYFALLAYLVAWIVAVYYFIQQFIRGEWDASEIGRFTGRIVVCLLLLISCGDMDGDGKRGDIVRLFGYVGYHLAYGSTPEEPSGNFISRTVEEQKTKFNTNYDAFVQNKLMVRINEQDMPVKYPGMQGVQTVAAVYTGQATPEQQQQAASQEFWIGLEFQLLNVCRSIISILDFFLLILYSFGILVLSLIAAFMCCVFVNRDLAKRFTYPFLWSVFTITVVFPALSQGARYFAYLAGNMALGTSGNPNYTFDPRSYTIISNGDPTPMILVAVLCMLISILFLAMSMVLSYSLVQGKLVESMNGLIANAFAGISSVGLGAAVSAYSTKLSSEGEKGVIDAANTGAVTQAGYTLEAQKASADAALKANETLANSGYQSTMTNAQAQMQASQQSALGQYLGGMANVNAERFQTVNGALANFRHNMKNMDADERKANADNLIELLSKNGDATSQRIAKELELAPDKASLLAEQYENILKGIPIGGSVASALGVNKEAMDSWMRTEGFKDLGQWMFGNPDTMQGGLFQNGAATSKMFEQNRQLQNDYQMPNNLQYQRPDGTMVDALTGQKLSNNVIDMTNPNNVVDYSQTPSVGGIFKGAGGNGGGGLMTRTQQQNTAAMNRLMKQDPNFLPNLQQMAWRNGWNPNDILNFMALETAGSFNKSIRGGDNGNYVGLIQFGKAARQDVGLPSDTGQAQRFLAGISASQQLPYVEKYLKMHEKMSGTKLDNLGKIYAAVGGGGGALRNAMKNGGVVIEGGTRAYRVNKIWDNNKDGQITVGDFGTAAFSKLGAGAYFDANKALGQIRAVDPATAKFLSKKFSADSTYTNTLANNQRTFEGKNQANSAYFSMKRSAEQSFTQDQINIADQKSQIQTGGLQQVYGSQVQSSQTIYGGQSQSAQITQQGSLQAGQFNYEGTMQAAQLNFEAQNKVAEMTKKAALENLYKKNMANLVQTVGNSTAHQISELFERASRGMN